MGLLGDIAGFFGLGGGGGGGLLGIPSSFDINIKEVAPIKIDRVKDVEIEHVKDVEIERVQHIAPVAAHIKEINHIDPLTVEEFNVREIKNIDPISVPQFNITNIPHVNVSLRQLPPLEMNVRRLPPVSVGLHQNFSMPSNYAVSARVLGFELMRLSLHGETRICPKEKNHREVVRSHNLSEGVPAVAGNPAIPFRKKEAGVTEQCGHDVYPKGNLHAGMNGPDILRFRAAQQQNDTASSP